MVELSNTIDKQFESKNYDEAYSVFKSIQKDTSHMI